MTTRVPPALRRPLCALALVAALSSAACGRSSSGETRLFGPPANKVPVPAALGGLRVVPEPKATKALNAAAKNLKEESTEPYVADSVVYALRLGKELKAVLQVSRLKPDARPEDPEWRREIVSQIGKGLVKPPERRGSQLVYRREGTRQTLSIWFAQRLMYVLIVRQDETVEGAGLGFDPDTLLDAAIKIRSPAGAPR